MGIASVRHRIGPAALVALHAFLFILAAAALGCGGSRSPHAGASPPLSRPRSTAQTSSTVESNVARSDYAGSASCRACHAGIAAAWEHSPMHRMTRDVHGADVRAPFNGTRMRFKSDSLVLEMRGTERFVRVESAGIAAKTYRVTRIIGGRTREDFAGVDVDGGADEIVLPVSYVLATRKLRYKGYSVMVHERATLRAGPVWNRSCIFCHNTVPEIDRLLGVFAGPAAGPYQGEHVDRWLPAERRLGAKVVDVSSFSRDVASELEPLGPRPARTRLSSTPEVAAAAVSAVRAGFGGDSLVELGIGCEACHGGSRQHAADPRILPSLLPVAPWLSTADAGTARESRARAENHACARCHQVLFSRYPYTWEGGRRGANAGGSYINSGEARDFLLGACASQLSCSACHDPHAGSDRSTLDALSMPSGNAVCTKCHADLADPSRLRAHAHHDPDGAGGSCVACHMPRKNMGLTGTLTRYHRIGSPTDPARVLGDRPIECALCHADRSVRSLVDTIEAWWSVRYPRQRLEELYGSLDANAIRATLERGKPHEQAVALATLGGARMRDSVPLVAAQLENDYPLVRQWAKSALVAILGACEVDLAGDDSAIADQASSCAGVHMAAPLGHAADEDPED